MTERLASSVIDSIEALLGDNSSAQGVVVQAGETLLDWQESSEPLDVYAVQKGILTLLIGIAEEKYLLETLDHINHHLEPEWTQLSPWDEAKLSIETLLSMTTGMADDLTSEGEINVTWRYNNIAYNYLKQILSLQSDLSLQNLSERWLFEPLEMNDTKWVARDAKLPNGAPLTGMLSTAKDLAQVGQLVLEQGQWQDEQLVPRHFIDLLQKPGPSTNPAWAWGWWNNFSDFYLQPMREHKGRCEGRLIPSAPPDLLAARGAYGNYLYVVPSMALVIVRTCAPQKNKPLPFEQQLWETIATST